MSDNTVDVAMEDNAAADTKVFSAMGRRRMPAVLENIVTEGDLQMKQLVQKQMKTDITLKGELAKVKKFSRGTVYTMPTDQLVGLINPIEFSKVIQDGQKLDDLRHFGLTEEEIALKLKQDDEKLKITIPKPRYGVDPLAHAEQSTLIEQKIADKEHLLQEPTTFCGAKPMTRHEMELEEAISRDRNSSKLFRCLLAKKSLDVFDPDHPINHLDSILNDILPKSSTEKRQKKNRKRRAGDKTDIMQTELEAGCSDQDHPVNQPDSILNDVPILAESSVAKRQKRKRKRRAGEKTEAYLEVRISEDALDIGSCSAECGSIVSGADLIQRARKATPRRAEIIDYDSIESVPVEVIERYKLSLSQIRELPRFTDYNPGEPSQVLYLKNLSSRVTKADLVSLFKRFQSDQAQPILIRLLHGRMKGQAFITFNSIETASEAMNLVNGYDFKGKPIIIEFGKKQELPLQQSSPIELTDINIQDSYSSNNDL